MPKSIKPGLIFFRINWKTVGMEHLERKQENIHLKNFWSGNFYVAVHLGHAPDYTK